MLDQPTDDNFDARLLKAQTKLGDTTACNPPDLHQWLEYWNDADSVAANLRKMEHWLQRAQQQSA